MSSYTVRNWVTIGLFGGLWGVVEVTLGAYLHIIFPPLSNTFLNGLVLGGIGKQWEDGLGLPQVE